jgi:hypothetical protein
MPTKIHGGRGTLKEKLEEYWQEIDAICQDMDMAVLKGAGTTSRSEW